MKTMKAMKKAALLLACTLVVGLLSGCGSSFDASAYLKALLDNSYKNDSKDFVDQKIGTAEEAEELYVEGIDAEVSAALSGASVSDDLKTGYEETFKNLFKNVKYTVGDAEKQSDGSYVVTVEYEQLQVFGSAYDAWMSDVEAYQAEVIADGGEVDETEMMNKLYELLKNQLDTALASPSYGDTQSTTITIELEDNVYQPSESDIAKLEGLLIDIDAMTAQ